MVSSSIVVIVVRGPGPGEAPDVPHERLVVGPGGVVEVPAAVAEVVEAPQVPAEVGPLLHATHGAEGVLQVRVNLYFLAEPGCLDLNEGRSHSLHVAPAVVERHPARADGALELVSVEAGVDDTTEQIVEDHSQPLGSHHAVKGSHENCLLWVEARGWAPDVVRVCEDPGDDLDLLGPHPPAGDLVVVAVPSVVVLAALGQEVRHISFLLEDQVEISSWWRGVVTSR